MKEGHRNHNSGGRGISIIPLQYHDRVPADYVIGRSSKSCSTRQAVRPLSLRQENITEECLQVVGKSGVHTGRSATTTTDQLLLSKRE